MGEVLGGGTKKVGKEEGVVRERRSDEDGGDLVEMVQGTTLAETAKNGVGQGGQVRHPIDRCFFSTSAAVFFRLCKRTAFFQSFLLGGRA